MSGLFVERDYQVEAREAVERGWLPIAMGGRGLRTPAVVLPTGAGKTVVFAHLIRRWLRLNPGRRAMVLAHRQELVDQAYGKLIDVVDGEFTIGMVMGNRNETQADAVVASVLTVKNPMRRAMIQHVGLIIVDECHHATAASYGAVLAAYPDALVAGFTATMSRSDEANLGEVWQDVVYMRTIAEMIRDGHLVRPRGIRVYVDSLDMGGVRKSGKDYREADLGRAIEGSLAPEAIAEALLEHSPDRQAIVFAPTVESARLIEAAIAEVGFKTGLIYGDLDKDEGKGTRRARLDEFKTGVVRVLVNVMVLTEGTDLPMACTIVIARPTLHSGLYIQMVGRGLRLFPGKDEALVIDVVGASQKHGLTAQVELFGEDTKPTERKTKGDDDQLTEEDVFEDPGSGSGVFPDEWVSGPTTSVQVDLFHGSKSAWMRTYGGIWFLAAGDRYIAILPGWMPGTYDVISMHRTRRGEGTRWVAYGLHDISYAMVRGENDVTPFERTTALKDRGWRKHKPSEAQKAFAARLGLKGAELMTSGELSRHITERQASARIDPPLPTHLAARPMVGVM